MTANQINAVNAAENRRHNRVMEEIGVATQQEGVRHNLATEVEAQRHNFAAEGLQDYSNIMSNAHFMRQDAEANRHNIESEAIGERSNANALMKSQMEYETRREDLAQQSDVRSSQTKVNEADVGLREAQRRYTDTHRKMEVINTGVNAAHNFVNDAMRGLEVVKGFVMPAGSTIPIPGLNSD